MSNIVQLELKLKV